MEEECEVDIVPVDAAEDAELKRLGEILVDRGDVTPEGIRAALQGQKRIGDILSEARTAGWIDARGHNRLLIKYSLPALGPLEPDPRRSCVCPHMRAFGRALKPRRYVPRSTGRGSVASMTF